MADYHITVSAENDSLQNALVLIYIWSSNIY